MDDKCRRSLAAAHSGKSGMIKPGCISPKCNNKEHLNLVFNKTHLPACISNAQKICATGLNASHFQKPSGSMQVGTFVCKSFRNRTEQKESTCSSYNDKHLLLNSYNGEGCTSQLIFTFIEPLRTHSRSCYCASGHQQDRYSERS